MRRDDDEGTIMPKFHTNTSQSVALFSELLQQQLLQECLKAMF